jgi:hypothetical protein
MGPAIRAGAGDLVEEHKAVYSYLAEIPRAVWFLIAFARNEVSECGRS